MYIPNVEFVASDWVFVGGVFLALVVGMVAKRETLAALTVLILTVGLSTSGQAAAGYAAVLFVLVGKVWQFVAPR